jgi:hypothetical protein
MINTIFNLFKMGKSFEEVRRVVKGRATYYDFRVQEYYRKWRRIVGLE